MLSKQLRNDGFSLVELLVTLAIVAIVAGVAAPSMQSLFSGSQVTAVNNQLVFSLQSARSEAIKRVTPVTLCPSADPLAADAVCGGNLTDGWIVFVDTNGDGTRAASELLVLQNEPLSPAFTLTPDAVFSQAILFGIEGTSVTASGMPISGAIEIRHAGNEERREIRIAASGRISSKAVLVTTASAGALIPAVVEST